MAAKRTIPTIKKAAPKIDDRVAELKEAAAKAPADDAPAYTHQGPGTGKAAAADPAASAAILNAGKAAAPVETKSAALDTAASQLRDRAIEDKLDRAPDAGGSPGGKLDGPTLPGQQAADSGTASSGGGPEVTGGLKGPAPAFSDGTNAAALDAAVAAAAGKLAESRPDLRGGLDVFDSVAGGAATPAGSSGGNFDAANPGRPGTGSDGGAEHAADAVGQVTSGGQSLFGDRLSGVSADIAIAEGLIGDQNTAASSPGVAYGPVGAIVDFVGEVYATYEEEVIEAEATPGPLTDSQKALLGWHNSSSIRDGLENAALMYFGETPPLPPVEPLDPGAVNTEADGEGESAGGGVENPGDPLGEGGKPTPAEMAFRQALRDALGVYQGGSGDIDPAETDSMPVGLGAFAGAANDNLGLIGRPAGPVSEAGGSMRPPPTGTDVDPVEGSAYSGPALGGNPEDVSFGSSTLPLESSRRSSSSSEDDDDDDDDDDDGGDAA